MLVRGVGLIICDHRLTPQFVQALRHPDIRTYFDVVSIK